METSIRLKMAVGGWLLLSLALFALVWVACAIILSHWGGGEIVTLSQGESLLAFFVCGLITHGVCGEIFLKCVRVFEGSETSTDMDFLERWRLLRYFVVLPARSAFWEAYVEALDRERSRSKVRHL